MEISNRIEDGKLIISNRLSFQQAIMFEPDCSPFYLQPGETIEVIFQGADLSFGVNMAILNDGVIIDLNCKMGWKYSIRLLEKQMLNK